MLPRSPGGLLTNVAQQHPDPSSPLSPALSTTDPREASEALRYYWSSEAGAGARSSQSSLGVSPPLSTSTSGRLGSSPYSISAPPSYLPSSRSHLDLVGERRGSAPPTPPDRPRMLYADSAESDAGPSNRRIHVVSYPSSSSLGDSPSLSDSSHYSGDDVPREAQSVTEPTMDNHPNSRASFMSAATTATMIERDDDAVHRTPTQPSMAQVRDDLRLYGLTPRSSVDAQTARPTQLAFVAPPDVSRRSLDALGREVAARRVDTWPVIDEAPHSAPPQQTAFGMGRSDDDKVKGRDGMLSPFRYDRSTPTRELRSKSPGRSPEPPPRSELRKQTPRLGSPASRSSPATASPAPGSPAPALPAPASPAPASPAPSKAMDTSLAASGTIQDLTDMLGGAIDAIGLIDSRDTPPPTLAEPKKTGPFPLQQTLDQRPQQPIAVFPPRQASLMNGMPPPVSGGPQNAKPYQVTRRASSILSFRSVAQASPTFHNVSAKPWPSAMLFGHIKTMKAPGDRARAYARATNELHRAESGLREWCQVSALQANRPVLRVSGSSSRLSLSRASISAPVHKTHTDRKVSSSSEFPIRADASVAREISTRMMDPDDQPTSLPPNLPYPQLQHQVGGIKPSPSMQSVSSVSTRRGFLSAIRMGKKDATLGPPQPGFLPKKDVRGLPISGPAYDPGALDRPAGPRRPRGSYTPPPDPRASVDAPNGSRARASLDSRRGSPGWPQGGREHDVRVMADVLPQVDGNVLRQYLDAHGDRLTAISAYIDDEKMGTVKS